MPAINIQYGKHKYSGTDGYCTDEATQRRGGRYRHTDGGAWVGNKERDKAETEKEERTEKEENTVLQAVEVTRVPVGPRKSFREPSHTRCRLLPTLVNSGLKCQYCRCLAPPLIEQLSKKRTKIIIYFKS